MGSLSRAIISREIYNLVHINKTFRNVIFLAIDVLYFITSPLITLSDITILLVVELYHSVKSLIKVF